MTATDWSHLRGIVAVRKPTGPTSHDIIDQLRRLTGERRIGHAGTLDPLASGVLVVGIGREATRELAGQVQKEKEYLAEVKLGMTSTTDDEDGEKTPRDVKRVPAKQEVLAALQSFVGTIQQVPPAYSAVKRAGTAAYKMARRGKAVELGPRTVEIKEIELLAYEWPYLLIRVATGPGTYVRALARDLGQHLETGGYIHALRRTRVGNFLLDDALALPQHRKERPETWQLMN